MCKVSVIIPVYNAKDYLARCLNSVCNQTLKDIEIICINDASTDNSMDILNQYAKEYLNFKVIDCQKNGGESVARNIGLDNATGEYIGFVDNDDMIDLDFYEKLYNKAIETNADIVKGVVKIYNYEHSKILSGWDSMDTNLELYGDKMFFLLYWWTAIYRRNMIIDNCIKFPEDMILGGDIVFLNKAVINANKVEIIKNAYYHWLRRENSGDSKMLSDKKICSVLRAYEYVLNSINNLKEISNFSNKSYRYAYSVFMRGIFENIYRNSSLECKKLCIEYLFRIFNSSKKELIVNSCLKEYPSIHNFLIENKKDDMIKYICEYDTKQKLIFDSIRGKLR